jgi:four helix bundle protein
MAKIEHFEDVQSWQKARELTKLIYELTSKKAFSRDFSLKDQIRRAAVSIMSNIAEGFESQNDKTFTRFLYIAKASCGEVRSQAYVALDFGYITQDEFGVLKQHTMQTSKLISGFITYLSKKGSM